MTYKQLRKSGNKPRVHGNGFLQFDLPNGLRLHIWDHEIPKQAQSSSIHDHAFGFKSRVLCGELLNYRYDFQYHERGMFDVLSTVRREGTEDTKLESTGKRANLYLQQIERYFQGDTYEFEPLIFHDTGYREFTATVIEKTKRLDVEPRILIPFGKSPDNEFDREGFDEEYLWFFVYRASKYL